MRQGHLMGADLLLLAELMDIPRMDPNYFDRYKMLHDRLWHMAEPLYYTAIETAGYSNTYIYMVQGPT